MLLWICCIFLLSRNSGNAKPLPLLETTVSGVQAADEQPKTRTMIEIIWGCVSTTFVCTWVSVHPNVPPRTTEEHGWRYLLRRLRLMFWALVAPELVLAWSAKQWYVAGKIADTYNERGGMKTPGFRETIWSYVKSSIRGKEDVEIQAWTRTHGHLVSMGGIVLIEPDMENNNQAGNAGTADREPTILTLEILEDLLKDPGFEIGFAEKEIADKAKGDFLSKSIVIFQTTWFIMQCVARFVQKITITELEVVTLALASLNAIMFFFWWSKPLGLAVPMKLHVRRRVDRRILLLVDSSDDENHHTFVPSSADRYILQLFENFWHDQGERFSIRWFFFYPRYALILVFVLVLRPIIFIVRSLYAVVVSKSMPSGATHVPTFYSPRTGSDGDLIRFIFSIFGAVFGGLHCLGWTLTFPTRAEQNIWKAGSAMITIIPLLFYWTAFSSKYTRSDGWSGKRTQKLPLVIKTVLRAVSVVMAVILTALTVVYLIARVTLLVEAVVLLRKQPTTVFLAVDWTKFI